MNVIHKGDMFVVVKAPVSGMCVGCVFEEEESKHCPRDQANVLYCYNDTTMDMTDDKILIHDTPESMAAYISKTLDESWGDEE